MAERKVVLAEIGPCTEIEAAEMIAEIAAIATLANIGANIVTTKWEDDVDGSSDSA